MLWSIVAVTAFGVLLGTSFRVPALLAATAATAVAADMLLEGPVLLRVVIPVLALQCAYLIGLVLGSAWRRLADGGR